MNVNQKKRTIVGLTAAIVPLAVMISVVAVYDLWKQVGIFAAGVFLAGIAIASLLSIGWGMSSVADVQQEIAAERRKQKMDMEREIRARACRFWKDKMRTKPPVPGERKIKR